MDRRSALVVAALALLGCAPSVTVPALVVGPHRDVPPWALFERSVTAARDAGYTPTDVDLDRGVFHVRPHAADGPDTAFVARFYQGGWIQVRAVGADLRAEGPVTRMSPAMRRELVGFVQTIEGAGDGGAP